MQAVGKFLLVKAVPPVTHSKGGIALPQAAIKEQNSGTLESVGPDAFPSADWKFEQGTIIHFRPISAYKVGDFLAVHVDDVLAYD